MAVISSLLLLTVQVIIANHKVYKFFSAFKTSFLRCRYLRACSHEPGTVNYPGVMIAPGQALPRIHFIAPGQVHRHLITTNLSEFL